MAEILIEIPAFGYFTFPLWLLGCPVQLLMRLCHVFLNVLCIQRQEKNYSMQVNSLCVTFKVVKMSSTIYDI